MCDTVIEIQITDYDGWWQHINKDSIFQKNIEKKYSKHLLCIVNKESKISWDVNGLDIGHIQ